MNFTELTKRDGSKYLYDFDTGWEIYDNGDKPAGWSNHREARNMDATETYADLRARFIARSLPECICPKCGLRHGGSNVDGGF